MAKKVLVTGATGNIAGYLIPQLISKGFTVNAYVHNESKADKIKQPGVEIFEGDFTDQTALDTAARGADTVFSLTPANADAVKQASAVTKAAKTAGAKFILRMSAIGAAKNAPTANGRLHYETDMEIVSSGIPYTILRPHFFMQNLLMTIPTITEQGNMYWAMGEGKLGLIDIRDIADCAAAIIINGGHVGKIYTPTGPESLTFNDIAGIISESLGRTVNNINVPFEAVHDAICKMGGSEWMAELMVDYSKAYAKNWGNFTNNDVQTITGHQPRSFKQFFNEIMAQAFKQNVQA